VLSGGLGSNAYVQNKLQEHFETSRHPNAGQVTILRAQEPQLVVVRGLLEERKQKMRSGNLSVLASRVARASYGVVIKEVNGQLTVDLRSTAERREVLVAELSSAT